jgi:hypothetical protein
VNNSKIKYQKKQVHDHTLSRFGTGISIKKNNGRVKRYTLNNNNKYLLTLTVLTSILSRYTLNNNNKYILALAVLSSMLFKYALNKKN